MTRVAALYDVHGNLPALEAVLDDVRRAGVDRVVVGGDVVLGPMPRETLALLRGLELPVVFLRGNCDREVVAEATGVSAVPGPFREAVRWVARELSSDDLSLTAGWPEMLRVEVEGLGDVLFCHATPRDDAEVFTRLTPEARLLPIFEGLDADIVVCGHTHMPFDRTVGGVRVVNAGSVGMPFGEPGADWLLLGPDVQPRRTLYDLEKAAERVRGSSYPQAAEFAARYVLRPPSERQMLEAFGKADAGS